MGTLSGNFIARQLVLIVLASPLQGILTGLYEEIDNDG